MVAGVLYTKDRSKVKGVSASTVKATGAANKNCNWNALKAIRPKCRTAPLRHILTYRREKSYIETLEIKLLLKYQPCYIILRTALNLLVALATLPVISSGKFKCLR